MLTFRDNPDRTFKLTEKFDLKDMRRLLLSDLIDADKKRALQKYLKQLENGQVEVVYTSKALGRLEGKIDKLMVSLILEHLLVREDYIDDVAIMEDYQP